jgi:hypothetical protein
MGKLLSPGIDITFSPTWWYHHYGMDFGEIEAWHNPILATERERSQRRLLFERFGDVGLGEPDPKPNPIAGGEYGHRFMSAFWGCEVIYFPDQWPHAVALPDAGDRMKNLELPDKDTSPALQLALKNARLLEEHYGHCQGVVNFGGPINNAVSVLGEEIFAACAAEPQLAQRVLHKMGEAVLVVNDWVDLNINHLTPSQARAHEWGLGNCPVGQISPSTYHDVVLPVDLWLSSQYRGALNLHHCGLFHPYTAVYRPLHPLTLDVGPGTNLLATRSAYPDTPLSTYLEVGWLAAAGPKEVDAVVAQMCKDAAPLPLFTFIRVAEVGPEISDDTVRNLMTSVSRIDRFR